MLNARSMSMVATVALVALAYGCQTDSRDKAAATTDSLLGRDLALAQQEQKPATLNDVPAPAPTRSTPKAAPVKQAPPQTAPPPTPPTKTVIPDPVPVPVPVTTTVAPTTGTIAEGTSVRAAISNRICTSAKAGDKFVALTSEAMLGSNGVSIPAGATVVLEVTSAAPITDSTKGNIAFRVRSIESNGKTYQVAANARPDSALVRTRTTETKTDAKKVAAGAIIGGILGQIVGKDTKGTVVGAAAGAAAGTAVAVATGNYEGCISDKGTVRITLTDAIVIPIG
jgi:hypothetical protein